MSEISIFIPDDKWFPTDCMVRPVDKQLCIVIHKYGNQSVGICQFRKADWLHKASDYFLGVDEKWFLDERDRSNGWEPSFATFGIIRCWKPLGLPANENERILRGIEGWLKDGD